MASDSMTRRPLRLVAFLILFSAFVVLIAAVAISLNRSVQRNWEKILRDEITRSLTQKARLFAARIDTDRAHNVRDITAQAGHDAGARATVIDATGKVLADSEIPVAELEKEGHSPEFDQALRGETGVEIRRKGAFGVPVLYVAVPISGGAVRLAYPMADLAIARAQSRQLLLLGLAVSLVTALLLSAIAAQTIAKQQLS